MKLKNYCQYLWIIYQSYWAAYNMAIFNRE